MKDLRKGKTTKLILNEEFGATNISNILESLGYTDIGFIEDFKCGVYTKDGKAYRFMEWSHFNGYVYYITIKEIV